MANHVAVADGISTLISKVRENMKELTGTADCPQVQQVELLKRLFDQFAREGKDEIAGEKRARITITATCEKHDEELFEAQTKAAMSMSESEARMKEMDVANQRPVKEKIESLFNIHVLLGDQMLAQMFRSFGQQNMSFSTEFASYLLDQRSRRLKVLFNFYFVS